MATAPRWSVRGEYLENCNRDIVCPCEISVKGAFKAVPDRGMCDVVLAFHLEEGRFGETDLANLNVGPLAAVAPLIAEHLPPRFVPITWERARPDGGSERLRRERGAGLVRPDHDIRCDPRPGAPGQGTHRHPASPRAGWRLSHARDQWNRPRGRGRAPPARDAALHGVVHALHARVAGAGRAGLGAMWGEAKAREYLRAAGFGAVSTHRLAHDMQNIWYVATP